MRSELLGAVLCVLAGCGPDRGGTMDGGCQPMDGGGVLANECRTIVNLRDPENGYGIYGVGGVAAVCVGSTSGDIAPNLSETGTEYRLCPPSGVAPVTTAAPCPQGQTCVQLWHSGGPSRVGVCRPCS